MNETDPILRAFTQGIKEGKSFEELRSVVASARHRKGELSETRVFRILQETGLFQDIHYLPEMFPEIDILALPSDPKVAETLGLVSFQVKSGDSAITAYRRKLRKTYDLSTQEETDLQLMQRRIIILNASNDEGRLTRTISQTLDEYLRFHRDQA